MQKTLNISEEQIRDIIATKLAEDEDGFREMVREIREDMADAKWLNDVVKEGGPLASVEEFDEILSEQIEGR